VIATSVHGDLAYVLLDTGSPGSPYLYGVSCERKRDGYWIEQGGASTFGWEPVDDGSRAGALSFWANVPHGAEAVRIEYAGEVIERPVKNDAFLAVWWGVPEPRDLPRDLPRVVGYRFSGEWR
jgi:hypothetical protein